MSIKLKEIGNGKILEATVSGKLTDEDYQHFIPEFERLVKQHGKIRMLFEMSEFHGWDAKAAWDDLKMDIKHYNDIERIAVVGENKWQNWIIALSKPFTAAQVRYFDRADANKARMWIEENVENLKHT